MGRFESAGAHSKPEDDALSHASSERTDDEHSDGLLHTNVDSESRKQLWQQMYSYMGTNLAGMRLSLPAWVFEPTTVLTRMAEAFEFCELLDRAAASTDSVLRDSLVAAFVVSCFSSQERVRKPFNPILGETYEFLHPTNDMKLYAEQVSHHPPISVLHAEGTNWLAGEVNRTHAKFQGNSLEVINSGNRYIHLTPTGDRYSWTLPKTTMSNLFVGTTNISHHGKFEVCNETTGMVARLEFAKSGWFSKNRYNVSGELLNKSGDLLAVFRGAWNRYLDSSFVNKDDIAIDKEGTGENCNRLWVAGPHHLSMEDGDIRDMFTNCTKFTKRTIAFDADYAAELPPTDSRLRPDRLALERGDLNTSNTEKQRIEQLQRHRAVEGPKSNGGEPPQPKYFRRVGSCNNKWEPIGNYWTESRSVANEDNCLKDSLW